MVLCTAIIIAYFSARPYAGGWNDGSRLATVESLIDHHSLRIDDSIFVVVPPASPGQPSPYPLDSELLQKAGTKDKLLVRGHFYSDKSPIPAFPMAGVYFVWRSLGGPSAEERPDLFCLLMTWSSSGVAYVLAVCCLLEMGFCLGLKVAVSLFLTLVFGVGTIALPYAQHVNNHILLLAVAALAFLALLKDVHLGRWSSKRLLWIGTLAGIGYTIDLAAGPLLCLSIGGLLLTCLVRRKDIALVIFAALPWVVTHHIVNYSIGGTFQPANAVSTYFEWTGSPFSPQNMTGGWNHSSVGHAILYSLDMQFGKKGFLGHNLLLFLLLFSVPKLVRRRFAERSVVITGIAWFVSTWLLYAMTSNNLSGGCCSIRWFVPLLIPCFLTIAIVLREFPWLLPDACVLGCGGLALGVGMGIRGPWFMRLPPFYWYIYGGTLGAWLLVRVYIARSAKSSAVAPQLMTSPSDISKAA